MEAVGTRDHPLSRKQLLSGLRGVLSSLIVATLLTGCSPGGKTPSTEPPKAAPGNDRLRGSEEHSHPGPRDRDGGGVFHRFRQDHGRRPDH